MRDYICCQTNQENGRIYLNDGPAGWKRQRIDQACTISSNKADLNNLSHRSSRNILLEEKEQKTFKVWKVLKSSGRLWSGLSWDAVMLWQIETSSRGNKAGILGRSGVKICIPKHPNWPNHPIQRLRLHPNETSYALIPKLRHRGATKKTQRSKVAAPPPHYTTQTMMARLHLGGDHALQMADVA